MSTRRGKFSHRATLKQQNKPFKGTSSKKAKKAEKGDAKAVPRVIEGKTARVNLAGQKRSNKVSKIKESIENERADGTPRLTVVLPMHPTADVQGCKRLIMKQFDALGGSEVEENGAVKESPSPLDLGVCVCGQATAVDRNCMFRPLRLRVPKWGGRRRRMMEFIFLEFNHYDGTPLEREAQAQKLKQVLAILDTIKVADVVLCLYGEGSEQPISLCVADILSLLNRQGLPFAVGAALSNVDSMLPASNTQDQWNFIRRSFATEFSKDRLIFNLNTPAPERIGAGQIGAMIRHLCEASIPKISWRNDFRGYMLGEFAELRGEQIAVCGFVRGVGFTTKYPVHVTGVGDFIVDKIVAVRAPERLAEDPNLFQDSHVVDENNHPPERLSRVWQRLRQDFDEEDGNVGIPSDDRDEEMTEYADSEVFDADDDWQSRKSRSECDDMRSDFGDSQFDESDSGGSRDEDEMSEKAYGSGSERRSTVQLERRSKNEMEFPDEVDTPVELPVRDRFSKYRILRSLKNSRWTDESFPDYLKKIYELKPYKSTMRTLQGAFAQSANEVRARTLIADVKTHKAQGFYACLYLRINPAIPPPSEETVMIKSEPDAELMDTRIRLCALFHEVFKKCPLIVSSLHPIERKVSINHLAIKKFPFVCQRPVPSKSTFLLQCGFRRFQTQILFSTPASSALLHTSVTGRNAALGIPVEVRDRTNHKLSYQRYLPDELKNFSIGSFTGPMNLSAISAKTETTPLPSSGGCYAKSSAPVILWLMETNPKFSEELQEQVEDDGVVLPEILEPTAYGNFVTSDPSRLIIKRILLTGYPARMKRKGCVVKRMFFNREDVLAYKDAELLTAKGNRGRIKEPLGTHGNMKCVFAKPIAHAETVCLPLYKRVFPPLRD